MTKGHNTADLTKLKPINFCGKTVMWQAELNGMYKIPFNSEPTIGKHDFNACKDCQTTLKELIKGLSDRFNGNDKKLGFPFCCGKHSSLTKLKEFKRASFVSVPEMVANKIIYTNQHIINNRQKENYYKDITDYIEYTVESFGIMPLDCGEPLYLSDYFRYVTHLLENNTEIEKERKNKLLEFLRDYQTSEKNTDLNILLSTYEKWFKVFPFEISFFVHLKPHFEKQIPIFNGKPEYNPYSKKSKHKLHTKGSLIDALQNLTKNLLEKVNIPELRKQGIITDIQANQQEIDDAELNAEVANITKEFSKGELKYVKALKKWLKLHKKYFSRLEQRLKDLPPQQTTDIEFTFENNFDTVSIDKINRHFKDGLFNSNWLTLDELKAFLKAAFELKQKPKSLFSIKKSPPKDKVMKVFYQYYTDVAGKPHGKQKEYAALLGEYFTGYNTNTVSTNFSKSVY